MTTERMKEMYNQKVHGKQYEPDDLVWLHTPVFAKGKPRKLHYPWAGPFRVVKRLLQLRTESLIYGVFQHRDVTGQSYILTT